jgi:hypothetical protein
MKINKIKYIQDLWPLNSIVPTLVQATFIFFNKYSSFLTNLLVFVSADFLFVKNQLK